METPFCPFVHTLSPDSPFHTPACDQGTKGQKSGSTYSDGSRHVIPNPGQVFTACRSLRNAWTAQPIFRLRERIMERRCFDCDFFQLEVRDTPELSEDDWDNGCAEGECHLNPPVLGPEIESQGETFRHFGEFPRVLVSDWCGQFQPRATCGHYVRPRWPLSRCSTEVGQQRGSHRDATRGRPGRRPWSRWFLPLGGQEVTSGGTVAVYHSLCCARPDFAGFFNGSPQLLLLREVLREILWQPAQTSGPLSR